MQISICSKFSIRYACPYYLHATLLHLNSKIGNVVNLKTCNFTSIFRMANASEKYFTKQKISETALYLNKQITMWVKCSTKVSKNNHKQDRR